MSKQILNSKRQLIFWCIFIGYAIIYQKIAYPEDVNPWYAEALHYASFFILFNWFFYAINLTFFKSKRAKFYAAVCFLAGFSCFFSIQYLKNYYIFGITSGLLEYSLMQIPEIFLLAIFALIFAQIEYTEKVNQMAITSLTAKNQLEISLNKVKLDKETLLVKFDNLVDEARSEVNINELKDFRQLVDFMINSTHVSLIPINLEIENLHRYINLYNLRAEQTNLFNLEIVGEMSHWQIPHKSILTLLENAIKHGDLNQPISIAISSQVAGLKIVVINKISMQTSIINSTKIGLSNLKERFQLHLKNRHKIEVVKEDGFYEVSIWVFLKNYQEQFGKSATLHSKI